jgi:general secretion pathway protein I
MRARLSKRHASDAGLSLVELAVAILILSIATLATFRALNQGARQAATERDRVLAEAVALNRAAELRLAESGLPDRVTMAGRIWSVAATEAPTEGGLVEVDIAVRTQEGDPGARIVTFVDRGAAR